MLWSLATGNDWRAIEAGAHAYAAQSGSYKGLSHWTSQPKEKLYGEITLPMPVATKEARLASTQRFKSATVF